MPSLGRLGLTPLSLLFVVAAAAVAVGRGRLIADDLGTGGPLDVAVLSSVATIGETLVVLLPVALIWRIPTAAHTHRVLFAGLAVGALVEVLRLGAFVAPGNPLDLTLHEVLESLAWLALPLGGLLVGLGLLRLRGGLATRRGMLVVIAFGYLVLNLVPLGAALIGGESIGVTWQSVVSQILVPVTTAFVGWVAVDAWLDHEEPGRFWGLLALAVPLYVAGAFVGQELLLWIAPPLAPDNFNSLGIASATFAEILALVSVALTGVALARLTPGANGSVTTAG
jgi:hypothetical protein